RRAARGAGGWTPGRAPHRAPRVADVDELLRRLEAAQEQQRALSRVSRAVARSEGLQPVLDEVLAAATRLSRAKNGRLWLLEDGMLRAFATYGTEEGYEYEKQHPLPIDRTSMAGRVALTGASVHIPDIAEDPEYAYSGPIHFRSGFHVPILLEDEFIGVIGFVREEAGP